MKKLLLFALLLPALAQAQITKPGKVTGGSSGTGTSSVNIVNNLNQASTGSALDAAQGLIIKNLLLQKLGVGDTTVFQRKISGWRLISPTEISKLSNTSGTNSGDQQITYDPATGKITISGPNGNSITLPVSTSGGTSTSAVATTLTVGTVTTGAAGSQVAVTITGTAPNQVVNFTIPQGVAGTPGANGVTPSFTIGTVTTLAAGANAAASVSGTAANPVLNLSIPQGQAGSGGAGGSGSATIYVDESIAGDFTQSSPASVSAYVGQYIANAIAPYAKLTDLSSVTAALQNKVDKSTTISINGSAPQSLSSNVSITIPNSATGGGGTATLYVDNSISGDGTPTSPLSVSAYVNSRPATTSRPSSVSAIVSAWNSATANATVHIQSGVYNMTGNTLLIAGKNNVTLRADKDVTLYNTDGGNILFSNGNNTNITIDGLTLTTSFTQASGTPDLTTSLIYTNEQGSNDGVEVKNCRLSAPWCRMNLITTAAYSSTLNGGNGTGSLQQNAKYHHNEFGPGGRMGAELHGHTNEDQKYTTILLRNVKVYNNYFHDLGLLARPDGVRNGMGPSISGPAKDIDIFNNTLIDCYLLGIETAGASSVKITGNTIDYVNQPFTGISVSDNTTRFDARNITITNNSVRSMIKGINLYRVAETNVGNNTVLVDQPTGSGGNVYIQECLGVTLTGGSVQGQADNTIRIDNSNQVQIGGGIRLKNDRVNFSLVSIFGSSGAPSTWINVNDDVFFVKSGNAPATSGVVETIGTTSNITGVR